MSTKIGLEIGDGFFLYQDMCEDGRTYLELANFEFEAAPEQIKMSIPLGIWELIRQCKIADTSFGERTDEKQEDMAKDLLKKVRESEEWDVASDFRRTADQGNRWL